MVRDLLRDVVRDGAVRVVVAAPEELADDGVVPAERVPSAPGSEAPSCPTGRWQDARLLDALGLDVPARKVVPKNLNEPVLGLLELSSPVARRGSAGGRASDRRVADRCSISGCEWKSVTRSSIDLGSRTKLHSAVRSATGRRVTGRG